MDDREAMMQAIIDDPSDDAPRLVYADWLDDHGDHDHAEFIRVQIELHRRFPNWSGVPADDSAFRGGGYDTLVRRERELLPPKWSEWMPNIDHPIACGNRDCFPHSDLGRTNQHVVMTYRRGFIHSITCTTEAFIRHAAELFASQPIESVTLSDRHPAGWSGGYGWYHSEDEANDEADDLPDELFSLIEGGEHGRVHSGENFRLFLTADAARAALSAAALRFGRHAARSLHLTVSAR